MSDENLNQDVELDETLHDESNDESQNDESTDWKAEALKYKSMYLRKAKKPEQTLETNQPKAQQVTTSDISAEDLMFFASSGGTQEDLADIKKLMKTGMTFQEAANDDLYKLANQKRREDAKREAASMGASHGSSNRKSKDSWEGLSKEEFEKRWKAEKQGK